ncbi:DsbA family protein [Candidatus Pacearchaeota archaeon]|nr:DsbA family protein [Candidatus Pacearchaeota archaeon]
MKSKEAQSARSDTIEIPVGKYIDGFRKNPWIVATIVLALALLLVIIFKGGTSGTVVSEKTAGNNLISFINSRGQGTAQVVSSSKNGQFYQVIVSYNGQDIPVYVTTDGQYLVSDLVPLSGNATAPGTSTTTPTGPVDVNVGDSPSKGNKDAKIVLVEFTDYQCPFCGRHYTDTYPQLIKDYVDTGKVLYVIKDFPLTQLHPEAQKAAEAARCVREQKGDTGYFAMHDKMFSNQATLSVDNEKKWARELGVDGSKFDTCLDSGKYTKAVQDEEAYGQTLGVSGTPTSFVNGIIIEGAVPYSTFKQTIDAELAK